ncbi:MAG: thiamine biosynthesis lipoprotein [Planctomycetota bacterium]|jgi:thiamine biosynthesis lipoprotein
MNKVVLIDAIPVTFQAHNLRLFRYIFVFLLYSFCIAGCEQETKPSPLLTLGGLTMGTTYTIKINEAGMSLPVEKINAEINNILIDINGKMSTYIDDSELSRINQSTSLSWIPVSPDLYQLLNDAINISQLSNGSFDITVGPLVNLWGFGPNKSQEIPGTSEISEALSRTGFQQITLRHSPPALQKRRADIYIDLSGIAKGYAVDKIAEYLEQQNIDNYMVEIGGEIRAKGVNKVAFAWRIGIEKPEVEKRGVQRVIKLDNIAMATSGDYRNYFEEDGKRYSHTIDPHSGFPITHDLASVTVLHKFTAWADALATAFLVMGKDAAYEIAEKENLAVLFLQRTETGYKETYTDAFVDSLLDN